MFGQQSNQPANDQIPDQSIDGVINDSTAPDPAVQTAPVTTDDQTQGDWQHPGAPIDSDKTAMVTPTATKAVASSDRPDETSYATNDLIDIKQKALKELSPLVDHLDQTAEERFKTTMMMIQASDDQSLVESAYASAQKIEDEKIRAQALLDIVNEINYFTAHHNDQAQ